MSSPVCKTCIECGLTRSIDSFYMKHSEGREYRQSRCKYCHNRNRHQRKPTDQLMNPREKRVRKAALVLIVPPLLTMRSRNLKKYWSLNEVTKSYRSFSVVTFLLWNRCIDIQNTFRCNTGRFNRGRCCGCDPCFLLFRYLPCHNGR